MLPDCPKKSNNNNDDSNNIIPQRVQLFAKWMLILEPTFQSFVFLFVALFVVVCLREWNANASGSERSEEGGGANKVFRRFSLLKNSKRNVFVFVFPVLKQILLRYLYLKDTRSKHSKAALLSTLQFQLCCCCCCFWSWKSIAFFLTDFNRRNLFGPRTFIWQPKLWVWHFKMCLYMNTL